MRDLICDFCSSPNPTWACPCETFETGIPAAPHEQVPGAATTTTGFDGDWLACEPCARLVRLGDRARLARRSGSKIANKHGIPPNAKAERKELTTLAEGLHSEFWRHRQGPPRRLTEEEIEQARSEPGTYTEQVPGPPPPPPSWLRGDR